MALWGNTDANTSAPKIVVRTDGDVATTHASRLGTTQYGNTVFGVSATEQRVGGGGHLSALTLTASGNTFTSFPTVSFTGGGTRATATATANVISIAVGASGGTGYTNNDVITLVGGTGTAATATVTTDIDGVVASLVIATGGDYDSFPETLTDVATSGGTGSDLVVDVDFGVKSLTLTAAGSGYTNAGVTISGGIGATATVVTSVISEAAGVAHAGWVVRKDRGNGRVQYETLVAMKTISSDGDDDTNLPDA